MRYIFNLMMKLSIIIPVYQSEKYIDRCIDSVLSQSYSDFEMILVDDGSTDGCAEICDETAQRDSRIRVFHRSNGGLSAARNTGIDIASGEYITFIDSDDEIAPDTLQANMRQLEVDPQIELLEYPVDIHHGTEKATILMFSEKTVSDSVVFTDWVNSEGYRHCYAWNKIYKRYLFDNIRFPEGETFEDAAVCPLIIEKCKAIKYSNQGMYIYHTNSQGITNNYTFSGQEPLFRHNLRLFYKVSEMGLVYESPKLWILCLNLLIDLFRCKNTDSRYLSSAVANMESCKPSLIPLLKASNSMKESFKVFCATLLGVKLICSFLGIRKIS